MKHVAVEHDQTAFLQEIFSAGDLQLQRAGGNEDDFQLLMPVPGDRIAGRIRVAGGIGRARKLDGPVRLQFLLRMVPVQTAGLQSHFHPSDLSVLL